MSVLHGRNHKQARQQQKQTEIFQDDDGDDDDDEVCNLRNQEGADRFRAEVEEVSRKRKSKSKSKVAQAAADNLAGNGIMGGEVRGKESTTKK